MTRKFKQTFSDIVAELLADSERGRGPRGGYGWTRPAAYNLAGDLFDPNRVRLQPVKSKITPKQAAELVRDGAALAFEG